MLRVVKNRFLTYDPVVFEDTENKIVVTQKGSRFALWFEDGYLSFDDEKKQYSAVFECPFIKNIILSGAACRGIMYLGVIAAMEEFKLYDNCKNITAEEKNVGFLDQIETFSCASIGAVISSLVAAGIRSDELIQIATTLDFEYLLGEGWAATNPFNKKPIMPAIKRNAKPLYQLMQYYPAHSIYKILTSYKEEAHQDSIESLLMKKDGLTETQKQTLKNLSIELNKISSNEPPAIITFAMLHELHLLYPTVFKDLYISVACRETGEALYLSHETAPDLEIALGGTASAAIPGFVSAFKIAKKYLMPYRDKPEVSEFLHFADGGYFDNSPYIAVDKRQKKEIGFNVGAYNQNLQSLVVLPDDTKAANYEGDMDEILSISYKGSDKKYQQSPLLNERNFCKDDLAPVHFFENLVLDFVPYVFGLVKSELFYTKIREEKLFKLQREYSQRIIPINSGVSAIDFERAQKHRDKIIAFSKALTLQYLKHHHLECVYFSYSKINDLIKNLPEDKYLWLKKNRVHLKPLLKNLNFNKLDYLREQHRKIPVSLWPKFNNFMRNFYEINNNLLLGVEFKRLTTHFDIIATDEQATDDVKMLRALSAIFDNLHQLSKSKEGLQILSFFSDQFRKYLPSMEIDNPQSKLDRKKGKKVIKLIAEDIKDKFYQRHKFYVIYQRIVYILHETKSSLVNPEDLHKRTFLETILNDIKDLTALSMIEIDKLAKLEEYLYVSYLKVIYYKGSDNSNLARALKRIIESCEILNLPYFYGVKLESSISHYPRKVTPDDRNDELHFLQNKKLEDFFDSCEDFKNFILTKGYHCTLKLLMDKTPLFIKYDKNKSRVIYQTIVRTSLLSPIADDRFYAEKLNDKITPYDFDSDKIKNRSLFFAVSLLTKLMWLKPANNFESTIYEDLLAALGHFVHDYHYDEFGDNQEKNRDNFSDILTTHLEKLDRSIANKINCTFFCCKSELHQLLKNTACDFEKNDDVQKIKLHF